MVRPVAIVGGLLLTASLALVATRQANSALDRMARASLSRIDGDLRVPGLEAEVQVLRDTWGVPHIYARSTQDLFFAQGYVMAQDRLWQMEMWRRYTEGRLAEIVGSDALARDRQARLLKYRGPLDEKELGAYHPEARAIMTAYVAGVNAFIAEAVSAGTLPVEFVLTRIRPEPWTVGTLVLRTPTFGDATSELQLARSVVEVSVEEANKRRNPSPVKSTTQAKPRPRPDRPRRNHGCGAGGDACRRSRAAAADRSRQQQLGRQRRAVRNRQAGRGERPAPRGHQPVPAVHRPSECAGMERRRRVRALGRVNAA